MYNQIVKFITHRVEGFEPDLVIPEVKPAAKLEPIDTKFLANTALLPMGNLITYVYKAGKKDYHIIDAATGKTKYKTPSYMEALKEAQEWNRLDAYSYLKGKLVDTVDHMLDLNKDGTYDQNDEFLLEEFSETLLSDFLIDHNLEA